ncbi:MAG: N-acetyltransferase, partial [Mesorhizobium sp.]
MPFPEKARRQAGQNYGPPLQPLGRRPQNWHQLLDMPAGCATEDRGQMQVTEGTLPDEITDLASGYRRIPAGKIVNAVTWMEVRAPVQGLAHPLAMTRVTNPEPAFYRSVFLEIGAPWLWDRAAEMSDADIAEHFADPRQHLYYGHDERGSHVGMAEFTLADSNEIEITYFGLFPSLTGRGLGKRLMAGALDQAWRLKPGGIWLHTSS